MKTRLDWLEDQLDNDELDEKTRLKYEQEANAIAERTSNAQAKLKAEELIKQEKIETISSMIDAGKIDTLIINYGDEFIGDYETRSEGSEFVVYSHVAKDNQPSRWPCSSEEQSNAKVRQLVYYRIYDTYYRDRNA